MGDKVDSGVVSAGAGARSYVSERYFLELDGKQVGFVQSIDGGGISAEVIQEAVGPDYFVHKHIGAPKYEDVTIQAGFSLGEALYEWLAQSWKASFRRRDVSIYTLDYNNNIHRQDEYFNALISEVTIPKCDGSSKEAGFLSIKISPEYTRFGKGSGKLGVTQAKGQQKSWVTSNFRLTIDGLDCTRVSRIAPITVKQTVTQDSVGERRDYVKEPTSVEFPNLTVTLAESHAESWYAWHEDFVIKGNNSSDKEKKGTLTLMTPNLKSELARIDLASLGIFKITKYKAEANSDQIKRIIAELYVEKMEFVYKDLGVSV